MKYEVKQVSDDGKTIRITTIDERWYVKELDDGSIKEYPSTSWQSSFVPKGIAYYKWLANKGWDEAESIKNQRGHYGSKAHAAIEHMNLGNELTMETKLPHPETGEPEEISVEEYEAAMSYKDWHEEVKPKILASEITVFNDEFNYAGTADLVCEIDGKITLIDFKISNYIWPNYEAQLSAYRKALESEYNIEEQAILQLNYQKNKIKKYKYNPIEYDFDLYTSAQKFWHKECANVNPMQKDYPKSISLTLY